MVLIRGHSDVAQALRTVREQVLTKSSGDRSDAVNVVAVFVNGW